jgi:hypothetical protein
MMERPGTSARAALVTGAALLAVYLATLAPGVTLWDAGEFAAAVHTLGIPHPPGTPLYILIARAFDLLVPIGGTVQATNLLSAVSTAGACAILAGVVARWFDDGVVGIVAGTAAGLMTTVWLSANETEVYAVSLLLSVAMVWSAWRAGREEGARFVVLTAFFFALAVPLHLSALVAAPAAIVLASLRERGTTRWATGIALLGAMLLAVGLGTVSVAVTVAGLVGLVASAFMGRRRGEPAPAIAIVGLAAIAVSVIAFMFVRARFDPGINQGNPSAWSALLEIVAREQYDVPGLWPRRAPLWLQVANMFEYADWQIGLGVDHTIGAGMIRTPLTLISLLVAAIGAREHFDVDRRSWWGTLVLLGSATFGVVVYLNLLAGPSFGYGVLPDDAPREARERDYFFALGFATYGLWVGVGVASLARRYLARLAAPAVALVLIIIATINWRAVDRRHGQGTHLAEGFGRLLLETSPPNAVLLVAGDNDTYPLWYLQHGEGLRPDVTTITIPLLGADWYRAELARRFGLLDDSLTTRWRGDGPTTRGIGLAAARLGRPLAATVSVSVGERSPGGKHWRLDGLVYVRDSIGGAEAATVPALALPAIDSAIRGVDRMFPAGFRLEDFPDGASRYIASLLDCPRHARRLAAGPDSIAARLLDSRCNLR